MSNFVKDIKVKEESTSCVEVKGLERGVGMYQTGNWWVPFTNTLRVPVDVDSDCMNPALSLGMSPFHSPAAVFGLDWKAESCYALKPHDLEWYEENFPVQAELHSKLYNVHRSEALCNMYPAFYMLPSTEKEAFADIMAAAVKLAEVAGITLHVKTVQAMQREVDSISERLDKYIELGCAANFVRTSQLSMRNNVLVTMLYRDYETNRHFGTYYDDCINRLNGEVETGMDHGRKVRSMGLEFLKDYLGLNLYYSNGQKWPVGFGFQDGNPMLVLARFSPDMKIQTSTVRIGRYLSCFDKAADLRDMINNLKVLNTEKSTHLCMTQREWHDAYNGGVESCMSGFAFEDSPVRIYAALDHGLADNGLRLFISYTGELFGENFQVQARAIVNTKTGNYVRAYGSNADALLRAAGYSEDRSCLLGCALAKVRNSDGQWMMPYQDGVSYVEDHGDHWVLSRSGIDACNACGYLEDYEHTECERCGDRVQEDDTSTVETTWCHETWCDYCAGHCATYTDGRGLVSDELLEEEAERRAEEDDEEEDEDDEEYAA